MMTYIYYTYALYGAYRYMYLLEYGYNTIHYGKKAYRWITYPNVKPEDTERDKDWIYINEDEENEEAILVR